MGTNEISYSAAAVWTQFHKELCGTLWEGEDIDYLVYRRNHDARGAGLALKAVHDMEWKGVESEDGVLATIKACAEHYGAQFTASQFKDMAYSFRVHYLDIEEPMADYLDEECGPVRWHWLNDHGKREIRSLVVKDSDIWVEDVNVSNDVWVFLKPGHS